MLSSTHEYDALAAAIRPSSRIRSNLEMVLGLTRTAVEALEASPEGVGCPDTVSHALALILERVEVLANDFDAMEGAGAQ